MIAVTSSKVQKHRHIEDGVASMREHIAQGREKPERLPQSSLGVSRFK